MRASLLIFFIAASGFAETFTAPPNVHLKQPGHVVIVIHGTPRVNAPYSDLLVEAARTCGIDPLLLTAVARRESAFNPNSVSTAGACGLMQLLPTTARRLGVSDIFDVRQNVFGGAKYLRMLLDAYHGDLDRTLAAYNAGPAAVEKYSGVPPFAETRSYVASIRAAYQRALR